MTPDPAAEKKRKIFPLFSCKTWEPCPGLLQVVYDLQRNRQDEPIGFADFQVIQKSLGMRPGTDS